MLIRTVVGTWAIGGPGKAEIGAVGKMDNKEWAFWLAVGLPWRNSGPESGFGNMIGGEL